MSNLILNIETASKNCSLALSDSGTTIFERTADDNFSHSAAIGVFAKEALQFVTYLGKQIDAVAVSEGPGSYTGLRIGVSFAKGLCFGYKIPLIAIPTLQLMAKIVVSNLQLQSFNLNDNDLLIPMLDARRMEVYTASFKPDLSEKEPVRAVIVSETSFEKKQGDGRSFFFGDGASKCKSLISSPDKIFIDNIYPSASSMGELSTHYFNKNRFVDTAYFEPFYLKEFMTTKPKNKVGIFNNLSSEKLS